MVDVVRIIGVVDAKIGLSRTVCANVEDALGMVKVGKPFTAEGFWGKKPLTKSSLEDTFRAE